MSFPNRILENNVDEIKHDVIQDKDYIQNILIFIFVWLEESN